MFPDVSKPLPGMRIAALVAATAICAPVAEAGAKEEAKAEHVRLSEEMNRLAGRSIWRGVERAYLAMEPLQRKGVALTYANHYQGAQAARELGNINHVYQRLQRALDVKRASEVENWVADIEGNYGEVELVIPDRWKDVVSLDIAVLPLFPDQRSTIGLAQEKVAAGKSYDGLLPVGDYTFADKTFTVVAGGETIRVELGGKDAKMSRREAGERAPFRFSYVGPRGDIGLAWTQGGDASDGGAQPGGFGGPGARLGAGVELGVGGDWAVIAQVGYQNLFGSPRDAQGALEERDEFATRTDVMHMGYGWLAGSVRLDDLWLAAGPLYSMGSGGVTGVNSVCQDKPSAAECRNIGTSDADTLRYQRLKGSVRAGGAGVGASYALWTVGPFDAAVSLNLGAQSDMSRWYPWANLAVTLAPSGPEGG